MAASAGEEQRAEKRSKAAVAGDYKVDPNKGNATYVKLQQ